MSLLVYSHWCRPGRGFTGDFSWLVTCDLCHLTRIPFRIQRDIPMPLVTSGVEYGHLRQLAMQRVKDLGQQLDHGHLPHRLLIIAQVSAAVTCERAKLASSMCITKSIRTKWSSFEETTSPTAAGKRFCRKNTLMTCNDLFSECLCRYEDPKQDILIGLLRSVLVSLFLLSIQCVSFHHGTVCVLSRIPPWLQASQVHLIYDLPPRTHSTPHHRQLNPKHIDQCFSLFHYPVSYVE